VHRSRSLAELKAEASASYSRFRAAPNEADALDVAIDAVRAGIPLADTDEESASLLTTLGVMLTDRYQVHGTPRDLEEGIVHYRRAVELSADSPRLALRLSNLGTGLFELFVATRGSEVLREAVEIATQALELTPPDLPAWPARVLNWSAVQLEALGEAPDDTLLDKAIDVLRKAIETSLHGPAVAQLNGNLATYLMRRYGAHRFDDHLRDAIDGYRRALEIGLPALYAPRIHSNLGNALWESFRRDKDAQVLEEAVREHRIAVEGTPVAQPARIDYLTNLGTSLTELARATGRADALDDGLKAWDEAWQWIDRFLGRSPVAHRLGLQDDLVRLSSQLVVALVDAPGDRATNRRRALRLAEGSKARLITQLLGWADLPLPERVDAVLAARERTLVRGLVELDRQELMDHETWPPPQDAWNRAGRRAERRADLAELDAIWSRIAASGREGAAFVQVRRGDDTRADDYRAPDQVTALLSVLQHPEETVFLLVRPGGDAPDVVRARVGEPEWRALAQRLYREIRTARGADRGETWLSPLVPAFREIGGLLSGVERVVIAPHRRGHLVPWAVVARRAGWTTPAGMPMPLAVVPALSLLAQLPAARTGAVARAMVVGDPLGDLPHAAAEATTVAAALGVEDPLMGPRATVRDVSGALVDADLAHIAAHARFESDSPLDSAIALADGVLTPREILTYRLHLELLVLSACETAMAAPLAGDELMGVTQAFLCAGVRSMIVTLWPVNDRVTGSLMATFYRELGRTGDRAEALALAATSVARRPHWRHPYYWAAFTLVGAWR
jgi:tetratricopeptide (TPR) repeat protein